MKTKASQDCASSLDPVLAKSTMKGCDEMNARCLGNAFLLTCKPHLVTFNGILWVLPFLFSDKILRSPCWPRMHCVDRRALSLQASLSSVKSAKSEACAPTLASAQTTRFQPAQQIQEKEKNALRFSQKNLVETCSWWRNGSSRRIWLSSSYSPIN